MEITLRCARSEVLSFWLNSGGSRFAPDRRVAAQGHAKQASPA